MAAVTASLTLFAQVIGTRVLGADHADRLRFLFTNGANEMWGGVHNFRVFDGQDAPILPADGKESPDSAALPDS